MSQPKRVKKKEHEKLSDSNIEHVYNLLNSDNPITKKDACEILNISYNTTRLSRILEEWADRKELIKKRRAEKRGKPATKEEISQIIQRYLEAENISEIASGVYRSASFVKNIIDKIGVPQRLTGEDKTKILLLPEQCISEEFFANEVAWSAVYHSACIIIKNLGDKYLKLYNTPCYHIYIPETVEEISPYFPQVLKGGFNAFSASYDLGKLEHLKSYGLDISKI